MDIEKSAKARIKAPPDSDGWKAVVECGELELHCIQDVVRAARAINVSGDRALLNALMGHISDQMLGVLSATIHPSQPNRSEMIHDVQHDMIRAVLEPDSKDGVGLCEAFVPRLRFRALSAIKKEALYHERNTAPSTMPDAVFTDESRTMSDQDHENLLVEQVLDQISDGRQRLAFRLHMEQLPYESSCGYPSISAAVGRSEKTCRTWIKEIRAQLSAKRGENT